MSKILIVFLAVLVLGGGSCALGLMGMNNQAVSQEEGINIQYEANQVNLAGYSNKIMDMVQVPAMARKDIIAVTTAAIQGRYGKDGAKAVFQAVAEQNPTVDPGLYRSLTQAMEAGRNSFDAEQKMLLDKCRVYRVYTRQFPNSMLLGMLGYPKLDQTKCQPVITDQTRSDFKNKTTGSLKLDQ